MVIHINPNRINTSSASGNAVNRRRQDSGSEPVVTPRRSDLNHIPSPESLSTMIRSAVSALKRGIAWDRGTILNLLV